MQGQARVNSDRIDALQEQVTEACQTHLNRAERFFGKSLPVPRLRFDIRGRTAGQYRSGRTKAESPELRFNPTLMTQEPKAFLAEVVPHEVAHLVAYTVYGQRIKPHGLEWQSVMRDVYGLEPRVTHTFDVPDSGRMKHVYVCGCEGRTHRLSSIRHKRIVSHTSQYTCRYCRQFLVQPD